MKHENGFTLIELIVVITILGILAATALPRFSNLSSDAKAAAIRGVAGAMNTASTLAHAQQLVSGAASNVAVVMDGQTISMSNGYPDTNPTTGILCAAGVINCTTGISTDWTVSWGTTVAIKNGPSAQCQVIYTPATAASAPVVQTTITNC